MVRTFTHIYKMYNADVYIIKYTKVDDQFGIEAIDVINTVISDESLTLHFAEENLTNDIRFVPRFSVGKTR